MYLPGKPVSVETNMASEINGANGPREAPSEIPYILRPFLSMHFRMSL